MDSPPSNEILEQFWKIWHEGYVSWAEIHIMPQKFYTVTGPNEGYISVGYKDFTGKYQRFLDFQGFQTVEEAVNAKIFDDNKSVADIICEFGLEAIDFFS
ncbi:MAG: hypothetical protein Q4A17_14410 [Thermoguttaceae bacterium]|nr:hypothetical protein [Thermoguttaceae bacterium]